MRSHVTLPLVAVLLAGPASSQESWTDSLRGMLLAQFGPGDLVLNKPLLDAIANEPACAAELQRTLGEAFESLRPIVTDLPAPHLAGTFQIHLLIEINIRGAQSELRDKAVDAVVSHMKRRLDQLLYTQPRDQLTKRREELSRRHAELQTQRARLLARAAAATNTVATLQQHKRDLEQQLLGARIDIATEKCGGEHLEKMLHTSTARREETRHQIARYNAELATQMSRLNDLTTSIQDVGSKEESERRRAEIANLQAGVQAARSTIEQLEEQARDQQRMLAVVLEQMPTSALATQRANARLQGLEEEQKALAEQLDAAEAARAEAGQCEAEAERLQIDISVSMGLLTEIQGKLARLQPVHYELMRQR